MKTLVILSKDPFDIQTKQFTIGGVQTYIRNLVEVAKLDGFKIVICEYDRYNMGHGKIETDEFTVYFRPYPKKRNGSLNFQKSYEYWVNKFNAPGVVFVVESDQQTFKCKLPNIIQIQHGVAFDFPYEFIDGFWSKTPGLKRLRKYLSCLKNAARLHQVRNTVCVDYNFYNWFRCVDSIKAIENIYVFPNFTIDNITTEEFDIKWGRNVEKKELNIVFARRFVEHRGAILFAKVVKRLFDENEPITVTIAGDGPCAEEMKKILHKYLDNRVKFTSYQASDSIAFHKGYDITIVPTIFSEGTSLSLAEAMASGCIPLCTHVGGMTNMVIDSYNGFLCSPTEESVYRSLKTIIHLSTEQLKIVAKNAYETSISAFNLELWQSRWLKVLNTVLNNNAKE